MIINKTFVINLLSREDRWTNINKDFVNTGLTLEKWNAVYGKKLSEKYISNNTTNKCYYFCSPSMIGCWLSHYKLWKYIVKNKYDNVLILEDDAYPVYQNEEFQQKLNEYWTQVPEDWDMVYLGCFGTCDQASTEKNFFSLYSGKNNEKVYKNNILQPNIVIPGFPLGTHAYMLSYKGAKKLINSNKFNKVDYHLDYFIATYINNNKDFKVYAFIPQLIKQHMESQYSDNQSECYPLLSKLTKNINASNQHTIDSLANIQVINIRKLNTSITLFAIILFVIALMVGLFTGNFNRYFIYIILIYFLMELVYGKFKHYKEYILNIILLFVFMKLGIITRIYLVK